MVNSQRKVDARRIVNRLGCVCLLVMTLVLITPRPASAQDRFGVEFGIGQSYGLTSYRKDVVYAEETSTPDPSPDPSVSGEPLVQPYLADETNGWGTHIALRLIIDNFSVGLSTQWHPREELRLHHQGTELISQRRRRPDGTYDDSGVTYDEIDEQLVRARQRSRSTLFVAALQGGWRPPWLSYAFAGFEIFVPIEAGITMVSISEPALPTVFGARIETGVGLAYALSDSFRLVGSARTGALATIQYNRLEDATRRAQVTGRSTEGAFFSTLLQETIELGVVFWVR